MTDKRFELDATEPPSAGWARGCGERPSWKGNSIRIGITCASCHERFESAQSIQGECSVCGAPVCFKCWALNQRTCSSHRAPSPQSAVLPEASSSTQAPAPRPAEKAGANCARCGRDLSFRLSRPVQVIYCARCQEVLAALPKELLPGAVAVDAAKYLETLFHRYVEERLDALRAWPGVAGLVRRRLDSAYTGHVRRLAENSLTDHPLKDALEKRITLLPQNRCVTWRAVYGKRRWWGLDQRRTVDFVTVSVGDLETLLEKGYVTEPADARVLGDVLEEIPPKGKKERVILAFSPTNWSDAFAIPDGIVLVGPGADDAWCIRHALANDELSCLVRALFDAETDTAKIRRSAAAVTQTDPGRFPLSARRVAREQKLPVHLVAEAFRQVSEQRPGFIVSDDPVHNDWLLDIR
jgi:hypothetical protein